jgi:hypothetical protein
VQVNCTQPANFTLILDNGTILASNTGITLTLGPIEADATQHFSASGTIQLR